MVEKKCRTAASRVGIRAEEPARYGCVLYRVVAKVNQSPTEVAREWHKQWLLPHELLIGASFNNNELY